MLLRSLPGPRFQVNALGLVSSHPAACLALLKRVRMFRLIDLIHNLIDVWIGTSAQRMETHFMRDHAAGILSTTNVEYLKSAQLRGSLFQNDYSPGIVSSVFTEFYVDHGEPLAALQEYKDAYGD